MAVFIDFTTATEILANAENISDQMEVKLGEIALNSGNPVEWDNGDRLDVMKDITLIAYLLALDLACYPLSVSAVVFFP